MDQFVPLGNFADNVQSVSSKDNITPADIDFNFFNIDHFNDAMKNIDKLSDPEIYTVIKNNMDLIVKNVLNNNQSYASFLVNPRFINGFTRVIMNTPVDLEKKLCCNKIAYDYLTTCENPIQSIKQSYLELSYVINGDISRQLVALGLTEKIANTLVLCRYSSVHEQTNIKRLNFAICGYSMETMTDQMIVYIYEKLFDKVNDLFQAIMFEVYSNEEFDSFGEEFAEVYGNVGIAVLVIINNMPSEKIKDLLTNYYNAWEFRGRFMPRFSLQSLSNDYERIVKVVEWLAGEGYNIP